MTLHPDQPGQVVPTSTDIVPTRYCLTCRYPLIGLPDNRCPECGRSFDPRVPSTYAKSPCRSVARHLLPIAPILLLLGQWLLYIGLSPHPLEYVLLLANALFLICGPGLVRAAALLSLALAPAVLSFTQGTAAYFLGTATLHPAAETSRVELVDRTSRLPRRPRSWCGVFNASDKDPVYDSALKMMVTIFGPMRGSCLGEYPTPEECQRALAGAVEIRCRELGADRIRGLPGGDVVLRRSVGYFLLYAAGHRECLLPNDAAEDALFCGHGLPARAVRISRQCVRYCWSHGCWPMGAATSFFWSAQVAETSLPATGVVGAARGTCRSGDAALSVAEGGLRPPRAQS